MLAEFFYWIFNMSIIASVMGLIVLLIRKIKVIPHRVSVVLWIIRPRIILPFSYPEKDMKYILLHEKTHIRRLDNLWRLFGFLAAAIHWFNPLSWVYLKVFLSDLELACDETAISKCSSEDRKEYAHTLLNCTQSKSVFVSAFGGAKVRTRIENILSQKPMTVVSSIGFAALVTAIIFSLLTNAG